VSELIVRKLVVHCSDTEDGPGQSVEAIRRYHVEHNGWADIGYHFLIERVGDGIVLEPGRPPTQQGAHCRAGGRNHDSLGVCIVGEFDEDPPAPELMRCVLDGLALLAFAFGVAAAEVYGHREFEDAKTCPGRRWNLDVLRAGVYGRLREGLVGGRMVRLDRLNLI